MDLQDQAQETEVVKSNNDEDEYQKAEVKPDNEEDEYQKAEVKTDNEEDGGQTAEVKPDNDEDEYQTAKFKPDNNEVGGQTAEVKPDNNEVGGQTAEVKPDSEDEAQTGQAAKDKSDNDEDEDENVEAKRQGAVDKIVENDFEMMKRKKKELYGNRRRKRKNYDVINANDDLIAEMIENMNHAAEQDRDLNKARQPAIRKLKYLKDVYSHLVKADLQLAFMECNVLNAMTEWLAPLPDKSLPHLQIREKLLFLLNEFPTLDSDALKSSGIGKAVMYLYKHPKETKPNREIAGKLIDSWSRNTFQINSDYKTMSKEEREERDYGQLPKRRRSTQGKDAHKRNIDGVMTADSQSLRPGDKGWVMRAAVPMPSNKDYVVRPKWNVEDVIP